MRKNKYDDLNQKLRAYKEKANELWEAQIRDCWVELEEPEKHGWYVVAKLRKDIANRVDAEDIEAVMNYVTRRIWTKEKVFGQRQKGNKCSLTGKIDWIEFLPWRDDVYSSTSYVRHESDRSEGYGVEYRYWENMNPKYKKWFNPPVSVDYWGRGWCECNIPTWYFERDFERCWATHYEVLRPELKEQEDWYNDKVDVQYYGYNGENCWHNHGPKDYRKQINRQFRAKCKQTLKKLKNYGYDEDYCDNVSFPGNPKNASWYW